MFQKRTMIFCSFLWSNNNEEQEQLFGVFLFGKVGHKLAKIV